MAGVGGPARRPAVALGALSLAAKTDALVAELRPEERTAELDAQQTRRLRLALEGRTDWALGADNVLRPRLQVGLRWDDSDLVRGLGGELAGGLTYVLVPHGLDVEGRGRRMLAHQDAAFRDWGASLMVRLAPGGGRGLQVGLGPTWGSASSQVERLWRGEVRPRWGDVRDDSWAPDRMRLSCSYGWGLAAGRLTPFVEAEAGGYHTLRAGTRLQGEGRRNRRLELSGEQHGAPGSPPHRRVGITAAFAW